MNKRAYKIAVAAMAATLAFAGSSLATQSFTHTVGNPVGISAREAGQLIKEAKRWDSTIEANKLMKLMALGVKNGDTVTVTVSGMDDNECADAMRTFFADYF